MNLISLLTKEKHVAGIEISDSVIRIAFFRHRKKKLGQDILENYQTDELVLIEEPIAPDIIADGAVINSDLLSKTLKNIWVKAKLSTDYAIVAIPDDKIHSRIFSFPKTIDGARLTEAMRLAIDFQIPMPIKEIYLDWERAKGAPLLNEILLSTIPRTVAQGYLASLELAGIKTLALESHLASIARAVKLTPEQTILFSKKTPDGTTVFAVKNGIIRFSRVLPLRFVSEKNIPIEIKKVKTALEAEIKDTVIIEKALIDADIRDDYAGHTEFTEPKSKWLISLGAAIRGKIPEGADNLISLLLVGTEEAYAYQKATIFITFIRNMTIGISAFFVIAFLIAYFFIFSLSQNANSAIAVLSATPISPELVAKENLIKHINALSKTGTTILADLPMWSALLDELTSLINDDIIVSSFSATSFADKMTITGLARNRETLNQFKKTLQNSDILSEIDLPITNLEQKKDIPFSISFRIKDLNALYYK